MPFISYLKKVSKTLYLDFFVFCGKIVSNSISPNIGNRRCFFSINLALPACCIIFAHQKPKKQVINNTI